MGHELHEPSLTNDSVPDLVAVRIIRLDDHDLGADLRVLSHLCLHRTPREVRGRDLRTGCGRGDGHQHRGVGRQGRITLVSRLQLRQKQTPYIMQVCFTNTYFLFFVLLCKFIWP